LQPDLDGKILVRRNHSEYPATTDKPAVIHDDLMVVYRDEAAQPGKAIYFDNEAHTIEYEVGLKEKTIVFTSEKTPTMPLFRLTYLLVDPDTITVKFEMSQDGQTFKVYTEGKCKRKKQISLPVSSPRNPGIERLRASRIARMPPPGLEPGTSGSQPGGDGLNLDQNA